MKTIKTVLFIALSTLITSCNWEVKFDRVIGNGHVVTEERPVEGIINNIKSSNGITVELHTGTAQSVVVKADENLIEHIKTTYNNGELKVFSDRFIGIASSKKVIITHTGIESATASSGSEIIFETPAIAENLYIKASSGASVKGEVIAKNLQVKTSSGANIRLSGQSDKIKAEASSGSNNYLSDVVSNYCNGKASSGANISMHCEKEIEAKVSSGANIHYAGNPVQTTVSKSSGGGIYKE